MTTSPEQTMPEPPDGRALYWAAAGTGEFPVVMVRDDRLRREWTTNPEARWFEANTGGEPMTYDEMREHSTREGYELAEAVALVPQSEVDAAVLAGGYETIGNHRIALGSGVCVTHGERYELPTELDRLRERVREWGS